MPDVSIIIPAFNSSGTIDRTLRSVRAQVHASWEAIVVDDGSADDTAARVALHAAQDSRIRLIRQANSGAGGARNTGLADARGDWVVFLDGDDTLAPAHLARMMRAVHDDRAGGQEPAGLYHCGWRRRREGLLWWSAYPAAPLADPFTATTRGCPFAIHAAMTRRRLIDAVGGFDPGLRICEDWDLWQRIARTGARFAAVSGLWADVHLTAGSLSGDSARHLADGLAVIRRGHAPDPRVADPHPDHAAGADAGNLGAALWGHALWMAGAAIGRGLDAVALLAPLAAETPFVCRDPFTAAAVLEDALVVGAGPADAPWPGLWQAVGAPVEALLAWLDQSDTDTGTGTGTGAGIGRALHRRIVAHCTPGSSAQIGWQYRHTFDLGRPIPHLVLPEVHRLHGEIAVNGRTLGSFETAVLGTANAADTGRTIRALVDSPALRRELLDLRLRGVTQLPPEDRARLDAAAARLRSDHAGEDDGLLDDVIDLLFAQAAPDPAVPLEQTRIEVVLQEERAAAGAAQAAREAAVAAVRTGPAQDEAVDYADQAYWEGIFSNKDPWDYRNPYEAVKYDQTIALLDGRRFADALEIACAEGEFTRRLAPLCERVLATDIAPSAVARAAEKLADLGNVTCRRLDLLTDDLPGDFDLIVCSEVLYYLDDEATLARFAGKVAEHLRPGGWFVTAHARLTADEPDATGFGWPHRFGAKGIGDAFAAAPGLAREAEFVTPLYRIQRFRKLAQDEAAPVLAVRQGETAWPLPRRIAAMVQWRGGKEIPDAPVWHDTPILMYHRIADDGPAGLAQWRTSPAAFAAQLRWLADNGWQGVSFERMAWAAHWGTPLPDKAVMLTFDDATRDFLTTALPLLHAHGFPATLFVPTDKVGGVADWDAAYGDPAPILGWDEITSLVDLDVTVCSHGAAHRHLTMLDADALLRDLVRSKAVLEARLGRDVRGVAYPFGDFDPVVREAARQAGYAFGFTCYDGRLSRTSDPLVLPRREVPGGLSLDAFAALVSR